LEALRVIAAYRKAICWWISPNAVLGGDEERLARARIRLAEALGTDALVDAAAVVANFNAIDRIADATGIPIDAERIELTADLRAELDINVFAENRM
jgi:hypothetical protein